MEEQKKVTSKKKIIKTILLYTFLFVFLAIFSFSAFKIAKWLIDSKRTKDLTEDLQANTPIEEVPPTEESVPVSPPETVPEVEKDDYWDFISQPYISVDFNSLKARNPDTVAWLYVNNTNVNYPVVQTDNNSFYLTHAFDKSWSGGGWIYMDYRNNPYDFGTNTIIYGHSMKDKSMFGTLLNTKYDWWYTNTDNQVIKMSTPSHNTLWRIFSIYTIYEEGYYITTHFNNNGEIERFFSTLKSRSFYDFGVDLIATDRIITLSTCNTSDSSERLVVHAKLISVENRQ